MHVQVMSGKFPTDMSRRDAEEEREKEREREREREREGKSDCDKNRDVWRDGREGLGAATSVFRQGQCPKKSEDRTGCLEGRLYGEVVTALGGGKGILAEGSKEI